MILEPDVGDEQGFRHFIRCEVAPLPGRHLDVGAGASPMPGAVAVDLHPRPGQIGADWVRLPFATGVFDSVSCINLLGCVPPNRIRAGLTEMVRVLRPGGKLVLTSPNLEHPLVRARAGIGGGVRVPWLRRTLDSMGATEVFIQWLLPESMSGNPLARIYGLFARRFPRLCPHFIAGYQLRRRTFLTRT